MNEVNPERWLQLWRKATNSFPPPDHYTRLMSMYSEPHRHYHNLRHVAECLNAFDRCSQIANDPTAVELAIWLHDAVYDPHSTENERLSAELAADWLKQSEASTAVIESVTTLILATTSHDITLNRDAPLLVDVDLNILGQAPLRFWEYEQQIRQEYHWVSAEPYALKRSQILEGFLNRPRIYQSQIFFEALEQQARINLGNSIRQLRA